MNSNIVNMKVKKRIVKRQLFPEKLWDLVNKPASGIQWSPDGRRIEVVQAQLEQFFGTKFRSNKFESFIRQLHFYGFKKCGNSYYHDLFQRDRPDALKSMKRKYSNLLNTTRKSKPMLCVPVRRGHPIASSTSSSTPSPPPHLQIQSPIIEQAIDYSRPKKRLLDVIPTLKPSRLVPEEPKVVEPNSATDANKRTAILYTLKPESDIRLNLPINFSITNENSVKCNCNDNSITFNLPENINMLSSRPSPQSLVIKRNQHGENTIITAYFVFKSQI